MEYPKINSTQSEDNYTKQVLDNAIHSKTPIMVITQALIFNPTIRNNLNKLVNPLLGVYPSSVKKIIPLKY